MTILFLTKDLMIQSNAASSAKSVAVEIVAVGSVEQLRQKLELEIPLAIFVDLQTPGLDLTDLVGHLEALNPKIQAFAFAQHVNENLLESARGESFSAVLTRGQFVNQLPKLVRELAAKAH